MRSEQTRPFDLLQCWLEEYLTEAEADAYQEWIDDLQHHDDPIDAARERVTRTAHLLTTIVTYLVLDNKDDLAGVDALLRKQTYRRDDSGARYFVYFCGSPVQDVEIFVDDLKEIDLVDIFNAVGFADVGIALRDPGQGTDEGEIGTLEQAILEDFHFDYAEDEISIVFKRWDTGVIASVRE